MTTGQELGKDLKQFITSSRPASPAPGRSRDEGSALTSPTALSHLSHLDVPGVGANGSGGPAQQKDFAAGYALGLVGGVRSWVSLEI